MPRVDLLPRLLLRKTLPTDTFRCSDILRNTECTYEFCVRVRVVFEYFVGGALGRVLGANNYNILFS
jgi:hypothetical protein